MSGNPGAASTTTSTFVGGGSPQVLGNSATDKVGFYGTTPVVQRTTTLGAAVATTVAVSTTTGSITSWGFSTSTQANNIVSLLNSVYGALTSIGMIST